MSVDAFAGSAKAYDCERLRNPEMRCSVTLLQCGKRRVTGKARSQICLFHVVLIGVLLSACQPPPIASGAGDTASMVARPTARDMRTDCVSGTEPARIVDGEIASCVPPAKQLRSLHVRRAADGWHSRLPIVPSGAAPDRRRGAKRPCLCQDQGADERQHPHRQPEGADCRGHGH